LTTRFLLDTNICIYLLRNSGGAAERLRDAGPSTVALSAVTAAELLAPGRPERTADRALERELLDMFPILPFDRRAAEAYTRLPFRRGRYDQLIAAHALSLGLILVTNNTADFNNVVGLTVVNWMAGA